MLGKDQIAFPRAKNTETDRRTVSVLPNWLTLAPASYLFEVPRCSLDRLIVPQKMEQI